MKNRISDNLDEQKYSLEYINYKEIHITDWSKETNKQRGVEVSENKPDIESVCVSNGPEIDNVFVGFKDNALFKDVGKYSKQCECVLFPDSEHDHWVLCIETKYSEEIDYAFKEECDYPFTMIKQIIETVQYFRCKNILGENQVVHAILSFPKLINDFSSFFFDVVMAKDPNLSITNISFDYKIKMKATNAAEIISHKRIKFK